MIVSMQDPIADMLTRIRNSQKAKHLTVSMGASKVKEDILRVLKEEGYILDYRVDVAENQFKKITVDLKYYRGRPVIDRLQRISKPGLRIYKSYRDLNAIPGFGIAILSTSKGIMTHQSAKSSQIGGEVLCEVA